MMKVMENFGFGVFYDDGGDDDDVVVGDEMKQLLEYHEGKLVNQPFDVSSFLYSSNS